MTSIFFVLLISYIILFLYSLKIKDNSIVDVFWGFGFILIAGISFAQGEQGIAQYIITGLVFLWGIRLTSHIGLRKIREGKEDTRYAKWREEWGSGWYFIVRSFFQIFILQMMLMLVVALPILMVNTIDSSYDSNICNEESYISKIVNNVCQGFDEGSIFYLTEEDRNIVEGPKMRFLVFHIIITIIGTFVSLFGFIFETIADKQLKAFLKIKKPGQIFTSGLYKYSRHPNYFGESMFWLGISLISLPYSFIGLIGWITITCLLLFVSGVPLQEARYAGGPEWEEYKRKTSVFIPCIPKG